MDETEAAGTAKPTTKPATKKARIHHNEMKDRHIPHWDMDYLSTEEYTALAASTAKRNAADAKARRWQKRKRLLLLAAGLIGLCAVFLTIAYKLA